MQNLDSPLQPLTRNEIDGIKSLHSLRIIIFRDYCWNWKQFANSYLCAAWKMSKHGVFSDLYFPIFGLIAGKYGTEKNSVLHAFHAACPVACYKNLLVYGSGAKYFLKSLLLSFFISPQTQDVNWTYIRRSEDVQDVFWTSYVRSIYVLFLRVWRSSITV